MKIIKRLLLAGAVLVMIALLALALPPIRERVFWRLNELSTQLQYALNPPEKQVFVPAATPDGTLQALVTALASTPLPTVTLMPTATLAPEQPAAVPTLTPTPLPAQASISNVRYVDQHGLWNYCAPANLAMALYFWGWQGDRTDIGDYVKPYEKDKNVMPYELAEYVQDQTNLSVVVRSGGTPALVKSFISAGYPVLIEKGAVMRDISGKDSWMGHYTFITGYDDAASRFITQDSFYEANYTVDYTTLRSGWRSFNYVFLIVYPPERENEVFGLLGPYIDEAYGMQTAAQIASEEINTEQGSDQFFAWFNRGTSLVGLQDYLGAAAAYDEAFRFYASLPEKDRPWRIVWYQTGPYFAYYYSGRYTDVDSLATQTIEAASEPYLEESFLWRARARIAMGSIDAAVADLRTSLEYHPGFTPSLGEMANLGVTP
jgi:hypothetical protein